MVPPGQMIDASHDYITYGKIEKTYMKMFQELNFPKKSCIYLHCEKMQKPMITPENLALRGLIFHQFEFHFTYFFF